MKYEGLLTDSQKRDGYFVTCDEDFVFVYYKRNGNPSPIAILLYETVKLKEIRDIVEEHRELRKGDG